MSDYRQPSIFGNRILQLDTQLRHLERQLGTEERKVAILAADDEKQEAFAKKKELFVRAMRLLEYALGLATRVSEAQVARPNKVLMEAAGRKDDEIDEGLGDVGALLDQLRSLMK